MKPKFKFIIDKCTGPIYVQWFVDLGKSLNSMVCQLSMVALADQTLR